MTENIKQTAERITKLNQDITSLKMVLKGTPYMPQKTIISYFNQMFFLQFIALNLDKRLKQINKQGGVAERLKAVVLKTTNMESIQGFESLRLLHKIFQHT
jgi:hypothetical protein